MLLRDPVEAEDAAQQTFLSAYRSLLAGTEPEHPAAWVTTIARNECWGRIQQRMREPVSERVTDELRSPLPDPVEAAARKADLAALVAAMGALPQQQRDALLLREFSGLSYAELAATLAVTEPAVESLLVRARRELRVRLQPVYAAGVVPFAFLREWIGRLGPEAEPALGTAAKIGGVPLAAKLAAGVATVAVVGGTVVAGDSSDRGLRIALRPGPASVVGVSDSRAAVRPVRLSTTAPGSARSTSRAGRDDSEGKPAALNRGRRDPVDRTRAEDGSSSGSAGPVARRGSPVAPATVDDDADDDARSSGDDGQSGDDQDRSSGGDDSTETGQGDDPRAAVEADDDEPRDDAAEADDPADMDDVEREDGTIDAGESDEDSGTSGSDDGSGSEEPDTSDEPDGSDEPDEPEP